MKITKKKFIFKLSAVVFAVLVILFLWWNFGEDPTDYSIFHKNWSTSDKSISFTSTNMKGIYGSYGVLYPGKVKYNNNTMDIRITLGGGKFFYVYYKSDIIVHGSVWYNPLLGRIKLKVTDLGTDEYYFYLFDGAFKINQELVFYKV